MIPRGLLDLSIQFPGQAVIYQQTVTSTNDVAADLARSGADDITLVVADRQTAGRGRRGRMWQASRGKSLLCSLILRPSLAPAQAQRLTMLAAVAAAQAIRGLGLQAFLKWPNDIMINERKAGGILTETEIAGEALLFAVIGIGVNVNVPPSELAAISPQATSLMVEGGRRFSRWRFLRLLMSEFTVRYSAMGHDGGQSVFEEWAGMLQTLGRPVTVKSGAATLSGRAEDVAADGTLLLRLADGSAERVTFGDVT